jgi:hypothetical protein
MSRQAIKVPYPLGLHFDIGKKNKWLTHGKRHGKARPLTIPVRVRIRGGVLRCVLGKRGSGTDLPVLETDAVSADVPLLYWIYAFTKPFTKYNLMPCFLIVFVK